MRHFLSILFAFVLTSTLSAQEVANSFLDKFGKDDNLEVVTIGKKMLQMMGDMNSKDPEFTEAIKGLENILIINSNDTTLSKEYYDTAYEIVTKGKQGFAPLLTLKDNDENLLVMVKESKGTVKELVLLSGNNNREFSMISLCGKIDLKTLAKYSEKMNLSGLKILDSISKN